METRLIIGYDRCEDHDVSTFAVAQYIDGCCHILNVFAGNDADELYKKLTTNVNTEEGG